MATLFIAKPMGSKSSSILSAIFHRLTQTNTFIRSVSVGSVYLSLCTANVHKCKLCKLMATR